MPNPRRTTPCRDNRPAPQLNGLFDSPQKTSVSQSLSQSALVSAAAWCGPAMPWRARRKGITRDGEGEETVNGSSTVTMALAAHRLDRIIRIISRN